MFCFIHWCFFTIPRQPSLMQFGLTVRVHFCQRRWPFFAHFKDLFLHGCECVCVCGLSWFSLQWLACECNVLIFTIEWPRSPQRVYSSVLGNATVFVNCKCKDTPIVLWLLFVSKATAACVCVCHLLQFVLNVHCALSILTVGGKYKQINPRITKKVFQKALQKLYKCIKQKFYFLF